MKLIAAPPETGGPAPIGRPVSRLRQMALALIGSVTLVNSALAQAPGLLWSTNIGASLGRAERLYRGVQQQ